MVRFERARCLEIAGTCLLFGVRRASRAVTQLYEAELAPAGLQATQLSVLVAAAARRGWTMSDLASALGMDRTTLTRNVEPLRRTKLLRIGAGRDQRTRSVNLTPKGHRALGEAYPLWKRAQRRILARLGRARWRKFLGELSVVTSIARAGLSRSP
jgi:DNA-binding MarR family transcriptional regulator